MAVGDLVINDDATSVRRDGEPLELTDTERRLLGYLAAHRERVVSKTQILTAIWGYDGFDENVVEVHVSALRRKLEAGGRAGWCTPYAGAGTGSAPRRERSRRPLHAQHRLAAAAGDHRGDRGPGC